MGYRDFLSKIRYWDNKSARWMMRHFYILFFEIVLVIIFLIFFVNALKVVDFSIDITHGDTIEKLLLLQSTNTLIIVLLMLLNSFWMLYMFNSLIRLKTILKDINYNISRRRQ